MYKILVADPVRHNCMAIIQVQGSQDQVKACTSLQFDGVIAVLKPEQSWVARWQRNGTSICNIVIVPFHVLNLYNYRQLLQ